MNLPREDWLAPHYNTAFANGTPFQDANPIFSAYYAGTNAIIRIVLDENSSSLTDWYQTTEKGEEYVINARLPELDNIKEKIRRWLCRQQSNK